MKSNFMLLDSSTCALIVSWVAAEITLIIIMIDSIKDSLRENKVCELKIAVEKNRRSQTLSDYYTAAADGDFDDRDYWQETAESFQEKIDKK